MYQASLDDEASKRVADEDDGSFKGFLQLHGVSMPSWLKSFCETYRSISDQSGGKVLGMVVYPVLGCSICKCSHIGIITICQKPAPLILQC